MPIFYDPVLSILMMFSINYYSMQKINFWVGLLFLGSLQCLRVDSFNKQHLVLGEQNLLQYSNFNNLSPNMGQFICPGNLLFVKYIDNDYNQWFEDLGSAIKIVQYTSENGDVARGASLDNGGKICRTISNIPTRRSLMIDFDMYLTIQCYNQYVVNTQTQLPEITMFLKGQSTPSWSIQIQQYGHYQLNYNNIYPWPQQSTLCFAMIQDGLYNPFIINNIQVKTYYYEHFLNFYPRAEESSHLTIQCDQFAGQSWFNGSFYPVFPESVVFIHKERQKMVKMNQNSEGIYFKAQFNKNYGYFSPEVIQITSPDFRYFTENHYQLILVGSQFFIDDPLSINEAKIIDITQKITEQSVKSTAQVYKATNIGLSSYFIVKIINFWNFMLLYSFLNFQKST